MPENSIKKPVICIADDQPDNLQVIVSILEGASQEYNLVTVNNGKKLVEIVSKIKPDLIITDWEMPLMNGVEATQKIKNISGLADIPVIICTGIMTSPDNLQVALEAGASDFIRKPVEATELIARVRSMLKLSESYLQIKKQKEELEILNLLKDRLLSLISYDVRAPLDSLKGMLYLFENEHLSEEDLRHIAIKLNGQGQNTSSFLDNLLKWAREQVNGIQPNIESINLSEIIQKNLALFTALGQEKSIKLSSRIPSEIHVLADQNMLHLVLRNLISNAIKFCHKNSEILIEVSVENQEVNISVKDSGVGISDEDLEKLFGMQHFSTEGTDSEVGTGLGLLLCKAFIEKNNGNIYVESTKDRGSKFWFTLPISQ